MNCYTIYEAAAEGIRVTHAEEGSYVAVGSVRVPVSADIHEAVSEVMQTARQQLAEHAEEMGVDQVEACHALLRANWVLLPHARVNNGVICRRGSDRANRRSALVQVDVGVGAGANGRVYYNARTYREQLRGEGPSAHVDIQYDQFPPPGIEVLAEDGHSKLIIMRPQSGFRIVRAGLLEDAPPRLLTTWTGSNLWVRGEYPQRRRDAA